MTYEEFKAQVFNLTKIDLNAYKERQMKRRLESLISKKGLDGYQAYFLKLKSDKDYLKEFLSYMTINVSEFYRNPTQWDVLESEVLPILFKNNKGRLKIWSAACSTGQEPYSLVMMLSKHVPLNQISIIATDIDEIILGKAQKGQYDPRDIKGIPEEYIGKYIHEKNGVYVVDDDIKKCITFKQHNLLKDTYPSQCDLIVCRNVLIYFTEDAKKGIYSRFNDSLVKDGVLFVGSTEQIINSQNYNFKSLRTFFYQKMSD